MGLFVTDVHPGAPCSHPALTVSGWNYWAACSAPHISARPPHCHSSHHGGLDAGRPLSARSAISSSEERTRLPRRALTWCSQARRMSCVDFMTQRSTYACRPTSCSRPAGQLVLAKTHEVLRPSFISLRPVSAPDSDPEPILTLTPALGSIPPLQLTHLPTMWKARTALTKTPAMLFTVTAPDGQVLAGLSDNDTPVARGNLQTKILLARIALHCCGELGDAFELSCWIFNQRLPVRCGQPHATRNFQRLVRLIMCQLKPAITRRRQLQRAAQQLHCIHGAAPVAFCWQPLTRPALEAVGLP